MLKSSPRLAYSAVLFVKMPIPTWRAHKHQHMALDCCIMCCTATAVQELLLQRGIQRCSHVPHLNANLDQEGWVCQQSLPESPAS